MKCSLRVGFWLFAERLEYINMGSINHVQLNQRNRYDNDGGLMIFIPVLFSSFSDFCGNIVEVLVIVMPLTLTALQEFTQPKIINQTKIQLVSVRCLSLPRAWRVAVLRYSCQ